MQPVLFVLSSGGTPLAAGSRRRRQVPLCARKAERDKSSKADGTPAAWTTVTPREQLTHRATRRRAGSPATQDLPASDDVLTPAVLGDVRKALKEAAFVRAVAAIERCSTARFTGLVYRRREDVDGDGVPDALRAALGRPELALVGVPPGIVQKAAWARGATYDRHVRLIAVYERIGSSARDDDARAVALEAQKKDIERQMKWWADRREALRTETDLMHPEGPEVYRETHYDFWE